jgi:integrase
MSPSLDEVLQARLRPTYLPSLALEPRGGDLARAEDGAATDMEAAWGVDHASRLRATIERLRSEPTPSWTETDLQVYLARYKRRQESTIDARLRQLRFMARHPVAPVTLHGTREELVNSFYRYVTHREEVEEVPTTALGNDHTAIRVLGDFLGIPENVWPTMPTRVVNDDLWLPPPEQVYELLRTEWTRNAKHSYTNHLIRSLLVFDFVFGPRFPSEAFALRLRDFDPERHVLTIREPKKSGRRRTLLIEPEWACCSPRHASLANYLVWRDKVDPERKQDAFFLTAKGTPFGSKFAIEQLLYKYVRPRFPWFNPYLGRHWCANARLVEWDHDYARVADWMGHESVNMTRRSYEHCARLHERLYGGDWLLRAVRKKAQRRTPNTGSQEALLGGFSQRFSDGRVGI